VYGYRSWLTSVTRRQMYQRIVLKAHHSFDSRIPLAVYSINASAVTHYFLNTFNTEYVNTMLQTHKLTVNTTLTRPNTYRW